MIPHLLKATFKARAIFFARAIMRLDPMFGIKDLYHLPVIEPLLDEIASTGPGSVVLLAGLEPRIQAGADAIFQPSGRSAVAGMLMRSMIAARRAHLVVLANSQESVRLPASARRHAEVILVADSRNLGARLERALRQGNTLLVVDRITPETARFVFDAAARGTRVIAQLDTILRGREVERQLLDFGVSRASLGSLQWVVSVTRLTMLCDNCRQLDSREPDPGLPVGLLDAKFYREVGCRECGETGRRGEVLAFEVYRAGRHNQEGRPVLPLEEYVGGLVREGLVPIDDLLHLETRQIEGTYRLLMASEEALAKANISLSSKVAEIEAANRVLRKQTEAAISLEEMSQALITYTNVNALAGYVCRKASELCNADRAILYLLQSDGSAEIVATNGWDPERVARRLDEGVLRRVWPADRLRPISDPVSFSGWPPGVARQNEDLEGAKLRAGLRVPLVAENREIGILAFNSTVQTRWSPRETALLQAFANSSALSIQRAGLLQELRDKIASLEAAQDQIARKERLERELELARQVQERMLPHIFPFVPGFEFAARNRPARQVGGDLYDVFLLDDDRFGVVIADVSDKGMPAALFMALSRSLILAEARREPSPYVVLQRVHRLLRELAQSEQFVTVFYGVIHAATRRMTFVRAGHEAPLLFQNGAALLLKGRGMVLGMVESDELPLSEEQVELQPGARLVLFTDGLIDALDPAGVSFGRDRLIATIERHTNASIESLCDTIMRDIQDHQRAAEQYDDMTLLAVQVN